jgi:uncharacterized protein YjiS (DUF1127 family)
MPKSGAQDVCSAAKGKGEFTNRSNFGRSTCFYTNAPRSATAGLADRLTALVVDVRESLRRRRLYRDTLRELNALSTRELNDLGIHRSMITRVALEAAYGR